MFNKKFLPLSGFNYLITNNFPKLIFIVMSFIKSTLRLLSHIFINKYVLVFTVSFLYMLFLDDHNLLSRWKMDSKIIELNKEYQYYEDEIKDNKLKLDELQNSDEYLEKFAREKYLMKKADEEIFIIK